MIGFSIMPPKESIDWHISNQTDAEISFLGQNRKVGSTVVAIGIAARIPYEIKTKSEFVKFFKQYREFYVDPNRYEIVKYNEIVEERGTGFCIQYHLISKDKNAYTSCGYKNLLLDIYGFACIHPDNERYAIDVSYSERYEEKNRPNDLKERARNFVSALRFEEINQTNLSIHQCREITGRDHC